MIMILIIMIMMMMNNNDYNDDYNNDYIVIDGDNVWENDYHRGGDLVRNSKT